MRVRGVAQMVECLVWDQDAAGSSPVTSTTKNLADYLVIGFFICVKTFLDTILICKSLIIDTKMEK